jgi:DNA-directed RNA polymerase specialized sigma24 family protein
MEAEAAECGRVRQSDWGAIMRDRMMKTVETLYEADDLSGIGMAAEQLAAVRALDALTDEQRSEVFYFYCQGCGRKQYREPADKNGCTCMKDE